MSTTTTDEEFDNREFDQEIAADLEHHRDTTTGEWTPYHVWEIMGTDAGDDGWKRERNVAAAHNAALAGKQEFWDACEVGYEQEIKELFLQLREQLAAAVEALQLLYDHQNGCPLPKYEKEWNRAMQLAEAALAKVKEGK